MTPIIFTPEHEALLHRIPLFRDLPRNVQLLLTDRLDYAIYQIEKNEVVVRQDSFCRHLDILLQGKLRVDIIDALGNDVLIEYIEAPRAFGTPHLFRADGRHPATFTAMEDGIYLTASKESVFQLISEYPEILKRFLCISTNCNKCTSIRLRALSQKNIRKRFVVYLFDRLPGEGSPVVEAEHNQAQLADYLCVTRPALSKEINKMIREGLIRAKGKTIELVRLNELKRLIL